MNVDQNSTWSISPNVRSTYTEDGAVLLDIGKGLCYSLNTVAARIWRTVEASRSGVDLIEIVDLMKDHYKISREQLQQDIDDYLLNLQKMGLVTRCGNVYGSKGAGGPR